MTRHADDPAVVFEKFGGWGVFAEVNAGSAACNRDVSSVVEKNFRAVGIRNVHDFSREICEVAHGKVAFPYLHQLHPLFNPVREMREPA
jgi:hypothetical protein